MTAGRRRDLITIQRATVVIDDHGGEVQKWCTYAKEWAAVFYGRGDERRQAAMEQGSQPATFRVLANEKTVAVTLKDRIEHTGSTWDIVGIVPDTPKRGEIEFTAVRAL